MTPPLRPPQVIDAVHELNRLALRLAGTELSPADEAELAVRLHQLDLAEATAIVEGHDPAEVRALVAIAARSIGGFGLLAAEMIELHQSGVAARGRSLACVC